MLVMSNDNIPMKDINNIKLLMRKRKKILSIFGESSPQFKKIENDFIIHTNSSEYSKDIKNWFK